MAAPLAGQIIRASDSFSLLSFTPSFTNLSIGSGAVNEGWYVQRGDLVDWGFRVQLGTSPTMTGGTTLIDLPVPAWTGGGTGLQAHLGSWLWRQTGVIFYHGQTTVFSSSGLTAGFHMSVESGPAVTVARMGTNSPTTPAVDHVFSGGGIYRAQ